MKALPLTPSKEGGNGAGGSLWERRSAEKPMPTDCCYTANG